MGPLAWVLVVLGVLAAVYGIWRAVGPWQRARGLAASEANLRRYESWRGGRAAAGGPSSAVLMQAELRRRVLRWGLVAVIGVAAAVVGLVAHP